MTEEKRKKEFSKKYMTEIKWLKTNTLAKNNKFLIKMLEVLESGSRDFTEKMHKAVLRSMKDVRYDEVKNITEKEQSSKFAEKINAVWMLVADVDEDKNDYFLSNFSALPFINSIKEQFDKYKILSKKQMVALNKVYKKYLKMQKNKNKEKK
ncbi:hypothetical protein CL614_09625 [archaeon]|nr:hypothetical protein [archaeon]